VSIAPSAGLGRLKGGEGAKQRPPALSGAQLRVPAGNVLGERRRVALRQNLSFVQSTSLSPLPSPLSPPPPPAKKNYKLILRGRVAMCTECKGASYDRSLRSPSRSRAGCRSAINKETDSPPPSVPLRTSSPGCKPIFKTASERVTHGEHRHY